MEYAFLRAKSSEDMRIKTDNNSYARIQAGDAINVFAGGNSDTGTYGRYNYHTITLVQTNLLQSYRHYFESRQSYIVWDSF